MQTKITVKIGRYLDHKTFSYSISRDHVIDTVIKSRPVGTYNNIGKYCDNFNATVTIVNSSDLLPYKANEKLYKLLFDYNIIMIEVEYNTHLKGIINHGIEKNPLFKKYIEETVNAMARECCLIEDVVVIKSIDYFDNSESVVFDHQHIAGFATKSFNQSKKVQKFDLETNFKDVKYRLFLDGIMIIERIFPNNISFFQRLEEILHVEIEPGNHKIHLEILNPQLMTNYQLLLDTATVDGKLINVSGKSINFDI